METTTTTPEETSTETTTTPEETEAVPSVPVGVPPEYFKDFV